MCSLRRYAENLSVDEEERRRYLAALKLTTYQVVKESSFSVSLVLYAVKALRSGRMLRWRQS